MTSIIIGHKNPDTDSIVSAIIYSQFKKKLGERVKAARAGSVNNETRFVLSYFKEKAPFLLKNLGGKKVILLDHGDSSQSAAGLGEAEVTEVIDHHYIGDIRTTVPIFYRAEPVGATSTIIYKLAKENGIKPDKKQAGLLLAGIISDTLCFAGPTTTKEDVKLGRELSRIAKIKSETLAREMFEARSSLKGLKVKDIVAGDYKEHRFGGVKADVAVFETLFPKTLNPLRAQMFKELAELKLEKKADFLFFLVIDILKKNSFLYLVGRKEKEAAEKIFAGKTEKDIMFLPGVVSRKKQVIPPLAGFLEKSK